MTLIVNELLGSKAAAAPATVSGEQIASRATGKPGRRRFAETREPGDLPSMNVTWTHRSGCTGGINRYTC